MTKLKVRGLKWQKLKVRGSVLHFCLLFLMKNIIMAPRLKFIWFFESVTMTRNLIYLLRICNSQLRFHSRPLHPNPTCRNLPFPSRPKPLIPNPSWNHPWTFPPLDPNLNKTPSRIASCRSDSGIGGELGRKRWSDWNRWI